MTNEQIGLGSERYSSITGNELIGLGSPQYSNLSSFNTKYSNITEKNIRDDLFMTNVECIKWKSLLLSCVAGKMKNPLYRCKKSKNQGYSQSDLQSKVKECVAKIAKLNNDLLALSVGVEIDTTGNGFDPSGYEPEIDVPVIKAGISTNTVILIVGTLFVLLIGGSLIMRGKR